jgi:hypothetical protein
MLIAGTHPMGCVEPAHDAKWRLGEMLRILHGIRICKNELILQVETNLDWVRV